MFFLENHWDRWLDIYIYIKCGGKIKDTKNKEKLTNIQPNYTRGGLRNSEDRNIGIGKGWNFQGIDCFNKLFAFIRQDREDHPGFTRDWLVKKRETLISNSKRYTNISPEGFAHWTLSVNKNFSSRDAINIKKSQ